MKSELENDFQDQYLTFLEGSDHDGLDHDGLDHEGLEPCSNCEGTGEVFVKIKMPCRSCNGIGTRIWINNIFDRNQELKSKDNVYSERKWFDYYSILIDICKKELLNLGIAVKVEMRRADLEPHDPYYDRRREELKKKWCKLMEEKNYVFPKKGI